MIGFSYPVTELYLGFRNKCKPAAQLNPPHVHAYRTTPNALTTTVKGITSDNTSHPPTRVSRTVIKKNWLVRMTSQPNLIVSLPWNWSSTLWQPFLFSDGYQGMPHSEHNAIPFWSRLNDSNGRMRYLPLYLFPDGDDGGLCWLKVTLTPCSEITLAMLYMPQIISLLLSVSCTTNKESGNTQYFI